MNLRLDHDRIVAMAAARVSIALIAERLKCSQKQVRRVLAARDFDAGYTPNPAFGTEDEAVCWLAFHALGDSVAAIAYKVGRSRQAVHLAIHQQDLALA